MIPLRDAVPARRRPLVTTALVLACVAVFLLETTLPASGLESFFESYGLVPATLLAGLRRGDPASVVPLATHLFLHAGWLHLAGNMLYLWIFGNNVEDRLGPFGFLVAYIGLGVVAAAAQIAVDPTSTTPLVGASGAISGVLGAYVVLYPRARVLSIVFLVFLYQLMEVPAIVLLGLWFVLQLLSGIASLGAASNAGVAVFAHIGGFVVGVVLGLALRLAGPGPRPPVRLPVG